MKYKIALCAASVLAIGSGLCLAAPAFAADDENKTTEVGEVLVTAQKRAENIQAVPLSVTAASGDSLREQHIEQLQELRFIDTSVQYRTSTGSSSSAFAIRGVGTASFSSGIEQSVSTVLDGVVLGDPSSAQNLADIDHVEILRGPQGMLFGKNASAGVISINTKDPLIGSNQGAAHLSYGENNELILQGILNVPISDDAAARLVVTHNHLDGWVKDAPLGNKGINPIDIDAVRAKWLWKPVDGLRILLGADASYSGKFCCSQVIRYAPDPHTGIAVANALAGFTAGPDNYKVANGALPRGHARVWGASGQVDKSLPGGFEITSISGYRSTNRANFYDADFAQFNFADVNGGRSQTTNWSEELRLTSPTGGRFDYVAGLFYFNSHVVGTIGQIGYFANPTIDTINIPIAQQILASNSQTSDVKSQDYAAFGQGNFHITDKLNMILGVRYTKDDLSLHYTASGLDHALPLRGFYPASGFPTNSYIGFDGPYVTPCVTTAVLPARPNCFPAIDQTTSAHNVSWKVGLQNQFTKDVMAYVTASRGYKGPGFSSLTITAQNIVNGQADQRILPEVPTSYEIGLKSQWFNHKLLFNLDAFTTTYKNFQAQVSTPTPNGFVSIIHNAGEVKTKGVEMNVGLRLTDDLSVNFNGSHILARYGDFPGVSCYVDLINPATGVTANQPDCTTAANATPILAAGTINARGHRLAGSPDYQYTLAANYEKPGAIGMYTLFANTSWYWQSEVQYAASGDPKALQASFGMLNGSVGFGPGDSRWRLSAYTTNLLNQHWAGGITPAPTAALNPGGAIQYMSPDSFRHVGVRLDAKF